MSTLYTELDNRRLPELKPQNEMIEILQREVYGYLPNVEYSIAVSDARTLEDRYNRGTVTHSIVNLTIRTAHGEHTFRVDRFLHNDDKRRPLILLNNFHYADNSPYFALEELCEYDVNYLVFKYTDITSDNGDFTTGIAPLLLPDGQVRDSDCGKIMLWAWGAMRVLDYGLTLPGTNPDRVAIAGHSRLGKTALVMAMMDQRVRYTFSNAAGCSGDSLARGNSGLTRTFARDISKGELIEDIVKMFPYWFCKNYYKYTETNIPEEFDQHYLPATIAPRYIMIGSCSLDYWADPESQQLCALAAGRAWENLGLAGLVGGDDRYIEPGEGLIDGHVGYFKLEMPHFLSRHGWKWFIRFIEKHEE